MSGRYCRRLPRAGETCAKQGCPFWTDELPSGCAARDRDEKPPDSDIRELLSSLRQVLGQTVRAGTES